MESHQVSEAPLDTLDWDYILQQSQLHNIGPLLYNNLKQFSVPIHKMLEGTYTYTAFHNMLYLKELDSIKKEFRGYGIKIIVLKGPALALDVYGNIALRPFVDVDILVKKDEMPQIKNILNVMGYLCKDSEFYEKYHFHLPCIKKGKINFLLELHWAFVDRFILNRIDMNKVWHDTGAETLPHEINILYLLLHIEKHAFLNKIIHKEENWQFDKNQGDWLFTNPRGNQLIWYVDLYELISSNNKIDWDNIIGLSKEWAIQHIVCRNLYILNRLYPLRQVENLLCRMPHYKIGSLKRMVYIPALRKKNTFRYSPDIQLRPIRALDLVDYLFPSPGMLKDYYRIRKKPMVMVYYVLHVISGLKEILQEFFGICQKKLSTKRKREYPARG